MISLLQQPVLGEYSLGNIILFAIVVIIALIIDIRAHREDQPVSARNALVWSVFWILMSLAFAGYITFTHGEDQGLLFLTGYLVEKSLSVDNLFVFIAIFVSFSIHSEYQHRVLYYGIIGAVVMRMLFIALGTSVIAIFGNWALTVFGLFVLWTAWQMWRESSKEKTVIEDYSNHWSVRLTKRFFHVHHKLEGHNFFFRHNGILYVTPLFLCLVTIEIADVMFAFDSVPAIFSILAANKPPLPLGTQTFLVYTSNIFAILGLRSLYFLLLAASKSLQHLEKAVIAILAFIGIKMLSGVFFDVHISASVNLIVILGLLTAGILASWILPQQSPKE